MKKFPVYTLSGLFLGIAAIPLLLIWHWNVIAAVCSLAGYIIAMKDFSKFTGKLQFFTQVFTGLMTGFALEFSFDHPPFGHFPFLLLAMFFVTFGTFGRIMFFPDFRLHRKHLV